jgi:hypothetical protein
MNRREGAVKHTSFSIGELMVFVAIFALDCVIMRATDPGPILVFLALGGLPMQGVLVIGLLLMFRRRRMEKQFPFPIGFEVVGWICLLVYVVFCFQAARSIDRHLGETLGPLLNATNLAAFSPPDWIIRVGLAMAYLTAPQLAIAVLAGWISRRWWNRAHPERMPTPA